MSTPQSTDDPFGLQKAAEQWRQVKPLLDRLASIHPASLRATSIGTDEQISDVVSEIQHVLNRQDAAPSGDAEAWQKAKPLLQALVALEPRCIPVLVEMARNLINDHQ